MKKYLALSILLTAALNAQGEFEVNKEVEGINKKIYEEGRQLKEDLTNIDVSDVELKDLDIDTEIDIDKDILSIDNITDQVEEKYDFLEGEVKDSINKFIDKKGEDDYLYFGLAGFGQVDGLEYGLQYSNSYQDLDYRVKLDRFIKGEDRANTNVSKDTIDVTLNYQKFAGELNLNRTDENYGGMKSSTTSVESSRKLTEVGGNFAYELSAIGQDIIKLNLDMYKASSESVSLSTSSYTRTWDNNIVDFYATYEKLVTDTSMTHLLDGRFGYLYDEMYTGRSSTLYVSGTDRFKIDALNDMDFNAGLAMETATKDETDNEFNFSADLEASKKIDNNLSVFGRAKKDKRSKSAKEIRNMFGYATDILAFGDLISENNYEFTLGTNFTQNKLFLEASATLNNSEDKIYFEEVQSDIGKENSIVVKNYGDTLSWMDLDFKATYLWEEQFRGEFIYSYTTLDKLSYIPATKADLKGVYQLDKYETEVLLSYNGEMYAKADKQNKLDSYVTVDWFNTYKFNKDTNVSFGIENIFDSSKEIMTDYPLDGRRVTLRFNTKY